MLAEHEGEGEMTAISVELDKRSERHLRRLAADTPRTFSYALKGAVRHARNRFAKVVRDGGGAYGVPTLAPHDPFTSALRERKGRLFGKFAQGKYIVMYQKDGGWVVGWPDGVTGWMSANQGEQTYTFDKATRHYFHRRLGALGRGGYVIPPNYYRPSRLVAEPFAANAPGWFGQMVLENYEKKAGQILARGGTVK